MEKPDQSTFLRVIIICLLLRFYQYMLARSRLQNIFFFAIQRYQFCTLRCLKSICS